MSDVNYARLSVLVIDDNAFIRTMIRQLLAQLGCRSVAEAVDGKSGLAQVIEQQPSLVICDIEMKPVNGFDFLEEVRNSPRIDNNDVPVIFLSNHSHPDIVKKAKELNVDAFLVKPVSMKALQEKIAYAINTPGHAGDLPSKADQAKAGEAESKERSAGTATPKEADAETTPAKENEPDQASTAISDEGTGEKADTDKKWT